MEKNKPIIKEGNKEKNKEGGHFTPAFSIQDPTLNDFGYVDGYLPVQKEIKPSTKKQQKRLLRAASYPSSYRSDEQPWAASVKVKGQRKYIMTREADAEIRSYFRERVSLRTFGNGREARVFIENVERSIASRYAKRSSIPRSGIRITKQDIHKTLAYMRKANDSGMRSLGYGIV
ncbi:MAG: hypothetical protein IJM27_01165 [Eubacterium sp.]|nr:hypothetical protein [Eubacterium sp.]